MEPNRLYNPYWAKPLTENYKLSPGLGISSQGRPAIAKKGILGQGLGQVWPWAYPKLQPTYKLKSMRIASVGHDDQIERQLKVWIILIGSLLTILVNSQYL